MQLLAIHHPWDLGQEGRRYLYCVCGTSSRFGASGQSLWRVPAVTAEQALVEQIRTVLTSPEAVSAVVRHARQDPVLRRNRINEAQVALARVAAMRSTAAIGTPSAGSPWPPACGGRICRHS